MISYLSAHYVYPVTAEPIKNGIVGIKEDGEITAVFTAKEAADKQIGNVKFYDGILVPGFINTHCHLELSHMRSRVEGRKGLVDFVQQVMKMRTADDSLILAAMLKADLEMRENGIVAVGDISNRTISEKVKRQSSIFYHTFLEVMGFNPQTAQSSMDNALELEKSFGGLAISIVPHAPYSVSGELFDAIRKNSQLRGSLVSIHNQESEDENAFFRDKKGKFLDLYDAIGLNIDFYHPSGKTSVESYLPLLSAENRTLLVHNTFSTAEDVEFAAAIHPDLYWCLCPGANLYIENRLPDVNMLKNARLKITLGTDSLASNGGLSILAEMKILQDAFDLSIDELLVWATLNGARFLRIDDLFGSLEVGKRPGVNLLEFSDIGGKLKIGDKVRPLFN